MNFKWIRSAKVKKKLILLIILLSFEYKDAKDKIISEKNNWYKIFQKSGTMNNKKGVFEIVLTKNGIINHRFF